jgi:hypothetical protein
MSTQALDFALWMPPVSGAAIGDGIEVAGINPIVTQWAPAGTGPGGGIPDAPSTGQAYGRLNAAWTVVLDANSVIDAGVF